MPSISGHVKMWVWNHFKQYIPKRFLVKRYARKKTGKSINLRTPVTFNDKLGWLKLFYRDEQMRTCTDKASVRNYVESCGLGFLLNECYGVYDSAEDIDWDSLPNKFVLKDTLSGDSLGVLLVFDKASLNVKETKEKISRWIERSSFMTTDSGNWIHEARRARIIAEKLLIGDEKGDLPDYKFFCFNGKVYCSYFIQHATTKVNRSEGELGILDRDFRLLPAWRADFNRLTEQPVKPKNYEKMVEYAEILSKPFPHVRVDFYDIDGIIIFGELTFFTNSGAVQHKPDSFDLELGKQLILPERNH